MKRLIIFLVCLLLVTTATADDAARRKKLVECINKDMDTGNRNWKLKPDDLNKLKKIVDDEIMRKPLRKPSSQEEKAIIEEIDHAAKKELPSVKLETVDQMINSLKEFGSHCASESRA